MNIYLRLDPSFNQASWDVFDSWKLRCGGLFYDTEEISNGFNELRQFNTSGISSNEYGMFIQLKKRG